MILKKSLYFLFFFVIACNQKPKIDGFGDLKLGMSKKEYQKLTIEKPEFKSLKENGEYYAIGNIKINSKIMLKNVQLDFDSNNKLKMVAFEFNQVLYDSLKNKFGIKDSMNINHIEQLNTNSDSIFLVTENSTFAIYNLPNPKRK